MEDTCIALRQALGTSQASLFGLQPHCSLAIGSNIQKEKKKKKKKKNHLNSITNNDL
jgi:hypothetical protein